MRVPLVPGATTATLRLVDAAGNASAPASIDLQALPAQAGATVSFDPVPAADETRATQLPAGQPVMVSGVTDPSFAGLTWTLEIIGTATSLDLPIGPDGTFSGSWTPTAPGLRRRQPEMPPPAEHHLRRRDQRPRRLAEAGGAVLADPDDAQPLSRLSRRRARVPRWPACATS